MTDARGAKQGQRDALIRMPQLSPRGSLCPLSIPVLPFLTVPPVLCTMPVDIKRTYTTRSSSKPILPSSPTSELTSPPPLKRKCPFSDRPTEQNTPSKKARRAPRADAKPKANDKSKSKQGKLTQLHFSLDTPTLRTCPLCDLSYTRGAPDDEALHKAHCARVRRGLEWGKDEEREAAKAGVEELHTNVKLRNGARGRVICFRPDVGGKIGSKVRLPVAFVARRQGF